MGEVRNDAVSNLLCALTVAGHFHIPEVLVVFDNLLMRANRTTKSSASSISTFQSPNYSVLGTLGLKIDIKWELVRPCKNHLPTIFHSLTEQVGLLKLTPFGVPVEQKTKFMVIESYGAGNVPTGGPFHEWLTQNAQKKESERILIVNISQVYSSLVLSIYATGYEALQLGLVSGGDMTCEAAVAKLSFLASRGMTRE